MIRSAVNAATYSLEVYHVTSAMASWPGERATAPLPPKFLAVENLSQIFLLVQENCLK